MRSEGVASLPKERSATPSNNAVLVTAALLRFLLNLNSLVRTAARDGERWAAEAQETRKHPVTLNPNQEARQQDDRKYQ